MPAPGLPPGLFRVPPRPYFGLRSVASSLRAAAQETTYNVGQTAASQAVTYDVTSPFTTATQMVRYDVLGWQSASQATNYDVGTTGDVASQVVTYDVISETDGSVIIGFQL